jgi:hypothetical protein
LARDHRHLILVDHLELRNSATGELVMEYQAFSFRLSHLKTSRSLLVESMSFSRAPAKGIAHPSRLYCRDKRTNQLEKTLSPSGVLGGLMYAGARQLPVPWPLT